MMGKKRELPVLAAMALLLAGLLLVRARVGHAGPVSSGGHGGSAGTLSGMSSGLAHAGACQILAAEDFDELARKERAGEGDIGSASAGKGNTGGGDAGDIMRGGGDPESKSGFCAFSLRWRDGAAACDEAAATVYLPWADGAGDAASFFSGLAPADAGACIFVREDAYLQDLPAAVREGHAFAAALFFQKKGPGGGEGADGPPAGMHFQIVLTGLPALCLYREDGQEIVGKEPHAGQVRLISAGEDRLECQSYRCSFHVRGNVSSTLEKKPYKVSLLDGRGDKAKAAFLDLRKDDDWILNPLYTDATRVREATAYALWEEVSAFADAPQASARIRYVELFLDDAYQGIYGLMEPVDRKELGLSPGDLLYKIDRWDREYPYRDLYGEAEEGGWMEIGTDRGFPCVEIRWPGSREAGATWKPMQAFHLFSFETRDLQTLTQAGLALDEDSAAQLSLFCALVHGMDNNWKNSFLIAKKAAGAGAGRTSAPAGGYVLYRTIWDLNYVFGDVFVYDPQERYTAFDADSASAYIPFQDSSYDFEALLEADPGCGALLAQKWRAWRAGGLDAGHVCALAEANMETLRKSGALSREMALWPGEDPKAGLAGMEAWIRERFDFLDAYFP